MSAHTSVTDKTVGIWEDVIFATLQPIFAFLPVFLQEDEGKKVFGKLVLG